MHLSKTNLVSNVKNFAKEHSAVGNVKTARFGVNFSLPIIQYANHVNSEAWIA